MQETRDAGWEDPLEEGMTTHSSILAWRIPWAEEPGGLPSMGSQRAGYDQSDLAHSTVGTCYIYSTRSSALGSQRGGMEGVGGKLKRKEMYVYIPLIHFVLQQKLTQHLKAIILQ